MIVSGALSLAGTLLFVRWSTRHQGAAGRAAAGRCVVAATVSVSPDAADVPRQVVVRGEEAWVLLTRATARRGEAEVRVAHFASEGAATVTPLGLTTASEGAAPNAGLVQRAEGVSVVVTRPGEPGVVARGLGADARDVAWPRGPEAPPAPAVMAFAVEPDGTPTALAGRPGLGARRLHARSVRESAGYTAARRDRWSSPALLVLGPRVLVAQTHREGSFVTDAPAAPGGAVEVAVMGADPFAAQPLRVTRVSDASVREAVSPRLARVSASDPAAGALIAWREGAGVTVGALSVEGDTARLGRSARVAVGEAYDHDLVATGCGPVVVWGGAETLAATRVDLNTLAVSDPVPAALASPLRRGRAVRAVRAGERVLVAVETEAAVAAWELTGSQSPNCALGWRPLALGAVARGPETRIAGLAGDASRGLLALSAAGPGAAETPLRFLRFDAARGTLSRRPADTTVPQGVGAISLLGGDTVVVLGKARQTLRLQRVDDAGGDEPGEDLLLREATGDAVALAASPEHHRIWAADVWEGAPEGVFRPAHGVVIHSAIEALEDGPRTDVTSSQAPEAAFSAMTLSRLDEGPARWAATFSASAGEGCLPGAWASLRDGDDGPVYAWGALLDPAMARCGDRVLSAAWRGAFFFGSLVDARGEVSLVSGLVGSGAGALTRRALDPGGHPAHAAVARDGARYLAVWLGASDHGKTLRLQRFEADGRPANEADTLGEVLWSVEDAERGWSLPLTQVNATKWVTVFRTQRGPRLARIECGD